MKTYLLKLVGIARYFLLLYICKTTRFRIKNYSLTKNDITLSKTNQKKNTFLLVSVSSKEQKLQILLGIIMQSLYVMQKAKTFDNFCIIF